MPTSDTTRHPSTTESVFAPAFPPGTVRVLQITDTHLYAGPQRSLLGVNTHDSFRAVIEQIHHLDWRFELVLATGDLVHDASPQGYHGIAAILGDLGAPVYALPGNHDIASTMREHLRAEHVSTQSVIDAGDWRIVMLDSVVPGSDGGTLAPTELELLDQALGGRTAHTLVCLHHQPIAVGSAWIDTMALSNGDAFLNIIDRHPHVRGILWGHIHQTFEGWHRNVRLMATPSTCVQFTPGETRFQVDSVPPGFRLLGLLPDGQIRSEVLRIDAVPAGLETASSGY